MNKKWLIVFIPVSLELSDFERFSVVLFLLSVSDFFANFSSLRSLFSFEALSLALLLFTSSSPSLDFRFKLFFSFSSCSFDFLPVSSFLCFSSFPCLSVLSLDFFSGEGLFADPLLLSDFDLTSLTSSLLSSESGKN